MWPRARLCIRVLFAVFLGALVSGPGARASGPIDHYRAGRQAWLEKDWETAARQLSLALADSLPGLRRIDALFCRADALVHLHECARAAEDASALRSLGSAALGARRSTQLERVLADCDPRPASVAPRVLPLRLALYGGAHEYSSRSRGVRTFGAELALGSGSLQGLVRGGWIGSNDNGGEVGLRLRGPSSSRLRPWIEGTAGLQRMRPDRHFVLNFSIVEWDSFTTTFGETSPGASFHGTSLGLGFGVDLPLRSFLGVGLACRWRNVHWKSDLPATLPGDDREISGYLFAH